MDTEVWFKRILLGIARGESLNSDKKYVHSVSTIEMRDRLSNQANDIGNQ